MDYIYINHNDDDNNNNILLVNLIRRNNDSVSVISLPLLIVFEGP
jgi:hypothetical protein